MTKKSDAPAIRFKGFSDAWEQRKLGELVDVCSGRDYKHLSEGTIPVYGTGGYMLSVNDALSYDRDAIGIGRKGTIDRPYILKAPFWTVDTLFYAIPREKADLNFAFDIFQNIDWKKKDESTGVPSLSKTAINDIDVLAPKHGEQQTIGQFFAAIDHLITLHQRKFEKLTNVKKSMLEKMFPQNGSSYPEIRFKGFTDPWEQRKFSELVQIERGGSPRPIDDFITDAPNGLNWVKIGDAPTQGNYITKTAEKIRPEGLSKTREVHPGDLILSNSMSFGKPYIMGIDGCIHDGWLLIRNTYGVFDLTFLCHLLGTPQMLSQYRSLAAGSTVNNLNKELVGNTYVTIPSITEQRVLGAYLEQLDNLITLHQRKCVFLFSFFRACISMNFTASTFSWEQRKAIDIADYSKGNGYSKGDLTDAGTPIILYGRLYTKYQFAISEVDTFAFPRNGAVYSQGNEVIVPASGETAEDIARASAVEKSGVLLGGDLNILRPFDFINPLFLALAISNGEPQKELAKKAQGKSVVHIHNTDIQEVTIAYPSRTEQDRIVSVFRQLDNLITLHQRELEKLQNIKKSMLEKMFV